METDLLVAPCTAWYFFYVQILTSGDLQKLKAYSQRLLYCTLGYALLLVGIFNLK